MTYLFLLLFGGLSFAQSDKVLTLADQSQIHVAINFPNPRTEPTFIFLPGIYRGFYKEEEFLQTLTAQKINWVAIHFSRHPESVLAGSAIWLSLASSRSLANEVMQVKKAFKIANPILVPISFSSSLLPYLSPKEFPYVIETAPMGRYDETTPPQFKFQGWESWMTLFPAASFWMAPIEFWSYRFFWMNHVEELSKKFPIYLKNKPMITEGLAQLSYSSRRFDLRAQDFKNGPMRFWILAKNEKSFRKPYQLEAIELYYQQRPEKRAVFTVPKAEHIVPLENPQAFVVVLNRILKGIARAQK